MKKKTLAMALSCALIAVVGIGSTFAYFTDKEEATNKVTMGHVDIKLEERADAKEDFAEVEGLEFENIVPGETIYKEAKVTLNGTVKSDVRVYVDFEYDWEAEEGKEIEQPVLMLNEKKVDVSNGYFEYTLDKEDNNKVLFDNVVIPASWGNECADKEFRIVLNAEAIQAENLAADFNWEDVSFNEYVAPQNGNNNQ